jgi:hypothetical protein
MRQIYNIKDVNLINIQYVMELKDLKNMSMNLKILALLDSRNINMPFVLYDLKIPHDKMFCENTNRN